MQFRIKKSVVPITAITVISTVIITEYIFRILISIVFFLCSEKDQSERMWQLYKTRDNSLVTGKKFLWRLN